MQSLPEPNLQCTIHALLLCQEEPKGEHRAGQGCPTPNRPVTSPHLPLPERSRLRGILHQPIQLKQDAPNGYNLLTTVVSVRGSKLYTCKKTKQNSAGGLMCSKWFSSA